MKQTFWMAFGIFLVVLSQSGWAEVDGDGNQVIPIGSSKMLRVVDEGLSTNYFVFDQATGHIGINSSSPDADLDIEAAENTEFLRFSDSTNTDSVGFFTGNQTPEGNVTAQLGSIFMRSDDGSVWFKDTGDGTNTGWTEIGTGGGSGDITSVGDVTSGAAFDGTQGNSLQFEGSTANGFETTLTAADPGADFTVTIPAITGTLITTGDTGTVTSTIISDNTITGTDTADDTFDFVDFADSMSLDATTTIAAGANQFNINLDSTGDFVIQDNGTASATFADDGSLTLGANGADGRFIIYSEQGATDYTVTLNPNATMTQNVTYALPADDGTSGQLLSTDGSGNLSWASAAGIGADSLDFVDFQDAMDLDASTTITTAANTLTINLDSTGDFVVQDNGTASATFADDGSLTLGSNGADGKFIIYSEQGATDYTVTFNPNSAMTENVVYSLPPNDGDVDQLLITDGSGNLSWYTFSNTSDVWVEDGYMNRYDNVNQDIRVTNAWEGIVFGSSNVESGWTRTAGTRGNDGTSTTGVPDQYTCNATGIYRIQYQVNATKASGNPYMAVKASYGGVTNTIAGSLAQRDINGSNDILNVEFLLDCTSTSTALEFWFRSDSNSSSVTGRTVGSETAPSARIVVTKL